MPRARGRGLGPRIMWPFDKHTSRRREIRRDKAERGLTLAQRLRYRVRFAPFVIAAVSAAFTALILNIGGEPLNVHAGQRLHRAITSRIDFQIEDLAQTRARQAYASASSPNHFLLDASLPEALRARLTALLALRHKYPEDVRQLREAAANGNLSLDDEGAEALAHLTDRDSAIFEEAVDQAIRVFAQFPLVEDSPQAQQQTAATAVLIDRETARERIVGVTDLLAARPDSAERVARETAAVFQPRLRETVRMLVSTLLRVEGEQVKPLYRFDAVRTAAAAEKAAAAVPPQFVSFRQHALLADVGLVSPREVELVDAEHRAYYLSAASTPDIARVVRAEALGRALLAVLVTIGLVGFVYRFKPRSPDWPVRQLVTALLLIGLLAITRMTVLSAPDIPAYATLAAQALAAAVLSIVYARVLIFGICGALAVLMALATHQGVDYLVTLLAVSGTFVFGLREVRNRGQIVGFGVVAAAVAALASSAAGIMHAQGAEFIFWQAAWAGGATLAAAFIVEGVLPGIERVFGITTNMTLLEWCDANKPLLRIMAAEAPGTYNHSLLVGALAEAAAEAVGANGLLARAGAYYHDIGKINKPGYFVENQPRHVSRHDRLSPAMSVLIIQNHVKDGIEMAKEYSVPPVLRDFIAEHHGTTVIEYFYHLANKARKPGDPELVENDFRYAGPKPQSRETAILMLCDGVEGAVRAMPEPTPGRIESVVTEIAQKRLLDGQFDECELTLRELASIEKSLIKSLCGIYHARIEYPDEDAERTERKPRDARDTRTA